MTKYQSVYCTGAVRIDFEDEGDKIVAIVTDMRTPGTHGQGINIHRGRGRYGTYEEAKAAGLAAVEKLLGPPSRSQNGEPSWDYNSH